MNTNIEHYLQNAITLKELIKIDNIL